MVNMIAGKVETGKFFFRYGFQNLLSSVPQHRLGEMVIGLMDNWYTCQRLWDKAMEKGITMIGALKSNRILYPNGKRCPASEYALSLPNGRVSGSKRNHHHGS